MAEVQKKEEASDSAGQPVRLYVKGAFITYRRGKNVIASPNHAIIQIDGVQDKDSAKFYFGKRIAYIYRAKKEVKESKYRVIWGKARGCQTLRVMLYPSRV